MTDIYDEFEIRLAALRSYLPWQDDEAEFQAALDMMPYVRENIDRLISESPFMLNYAGSCDAVLETLDMEDTPENRRAGAFIYGLWMALNLGFYDKRTVRIRVRVDRNGLEIVKVYGAT